MDTTIMGASGIKTVKITGTSTAAWSSQSLLRVALVLDNTGSMADAGKMPALQTAAKNMLSKLASASTTNGDGLCLDRSLREGRQSRRRQLQFQLSRLDALG